MEKYIILKKGRNSEPYANGLVGTNLETINAPLFDSIDEARQYLEESDFPQFPYYIVKIDLFQP